VSTKILPLSIHWFTLLEGLTLGGEKGDGVEIARFAFFEYLTPVPFPEATGQAEIAEITKLKSEVSGARLSLGRWNRQAGEPA
jgi:hypothetical protein